MSEPSSQEILTVTKSVKQSNEPKPDKLKHRHRRKSQNYGESWKRWPILALYTMFNVNIAFQVCLFWALTGSELEIVRKLRDTFQMFMFQPISPMVAEFYNTSDEVIIWLAQMSLCIFVVVLFPVAFLSDAVSVRRKSSCFLVHAIFWMTYMMHINYHIILIIILYD